MKKISVTLLAFALLFSPALAAPKAPVPAAPQKVCITPESIIKADKVEPYAHLKGDDLVKFHKGYESETKRPAPDIDEVVVYSDPEGKLVVILGFSKGCGVGATMLSKKAFDKYRLGGGESI